MSGSVIKGLTSIMLLTDGYCAMQVQQAKQALNAAFQGAKGKKKGKKVLRFCFDCCSADT